MEKWIYDKKINEARRLKTSDLNNDFFILKIGDIWFSPGNPGSDGLGAWIMDNDFWRAIDYYQIPYKLVIHKLRKLVKLGYIDFSSCYYMRLDIEMTKDGARRYKELKAEDRYHQFLK